MENNFAEETVICLWQRKGNKKKNAKKNRSRRDVNWKLFARDVIMVFACVLRREMLHG